MILTAQQALLAEKPDTLILIDYPSFNLKMAKFCKQHLPQTKIIYYIPHFVKQKRATGRSKSLRAPSFNAKMKRGNFTVSELEDIASALGITLKVEFIINKGEMD